MNILLLNGGKQFGHSQGRLNQTLHDHAHSVLVSYGHVVQATIIDQGYDVEQEVEKFSYAFNHSHIVACKEAFRG